MNYKQVNEKFYSNNYWGLDRSKNKYFSKYVRVKVLSKFMKDVNKGILYDAGGGVGNYGWYFSPDFKKVIVSDISKIAINKIPEKEIVKLHCSVLKNRLPANSVDCILLIDVFEHIQTKDLLKMMKDLKRILKPNGRILIYTSYYGWTLRLILQRIFYPKNRMWRDEEAHLNRLNMTELKDLFNKSGLEINNHYFYAFFFQQITDGVKDSCARLISKLRKQKQNDVKLGREGQTVKEEIREGNKFKKLLLFFSYVSYLDILIFGKLPIGNAVFFSLKKSKK